MTEKHIWKTQDPTRSMGPAAQHNCCRWWPPGISGGVWTWYHLRWSLTVSLDSFHFLCWSSDLKSVHQISELGALQPLLAALMTSVSQNHCLYLQSSKFVPKIKYYYICRNVEPNESMPYLFQWTSHQTSFHQLSPLEGQLWFAAIDLDTCNNKKVLWWFL